MSDLNQMPDPKPVGRPLKPIEVEWLRERHRFHTETGHVPGQPQRTGVDSCITCSLLALIDAAPRAATEPPERQLVEALERMLRNPGTYHDYGTLRLGIEAALYSDAWAQEDARE